MNNPLNKQRDEYINRVNRVIDYIDLNLDAELSLGLLSEIAGFSIYHFHRIFKSIVHEPLNKYVQRLRIEKAANQLIYNPNKSITEIAFNCGFSSSQFFSKIFKQYFNINAGDWRRNKSIYSKKLHIKSKKMEDSVTASGYITGSKEHLITIKPEVEVRTLPDKEAAYIRHIGKYKGDADLFNSLFLKLFKWAEARDLLDENTKVIVVYNDMSDITEESRFRLSVCVTISKKFNADGVVGKLKIQGGKYAVARVKIAQGEFEDAWDFLYSEWLPESGFQPDDKPGFEIYPEEPRNGKYIVDLCLPVIPL